MTIVSQALLKKLKKWLSEKGQKYFTTVWLKEGDLISCHFFEGMQVRNWLRKQDECKDWDSHKLDNNWMEIVQECLRDKS